MITLKRCDCSAWPPSDFHRRYFVSCSVQFNLQNCNRNLLTLHFYNYERSIRRTRIMVNITCNNRYSYHKYDVYNLALWRYKENVYKVSLCILITRHLFLDLAKNPTLIFVLDTRPLRGKWSKNKICMYIYVCMHVLCVYVCV